jgi:hypothetical protein
MFGDRLNPLQKQILEHLDVSSRSSRVMREFFKGAAQKIIDQPPKGQTGFMGIPSQTKEELVNAVINKQRTDKGNEPLPVAISTPASQRLEEPHAGGVVRAGGMGGDERERVPESPKDERECYTAPNGAKRIIVIVKPVKVLPKGILVGTKFPVILRNPTERQIKDKSRPFVSIPGRKKQTKRNNTPRISNVR